MINDMRTTLDLDDDILQAVKEPGRDKERKTAGQMLSELARKAFAPARRRRVHSQVRKRRAAATAAVPDTPIDDECRRQPAVV